MLLNQVVVLANERGMQQEPTTRWNEPRGKAQVAVADAPTAATAAAAELVDCCVGAGSLRSSNVMKARPKHCCGAFEALFAPVHGPRHRELSGMPVPSCWECSGCK